MDDFNIGESFEQAFSEIVSFLPDLLGALLLLIIGYFVAKGLGGLTRRALRRLRFDRAVNTSPVGNAISRIVDSPSGMAGTVVYWLVFLAFISFAVAALNLELLNGIMAGIYAYLPHVIAAILIFLVASAVSAGTGSFVQRVLGRTPTARLVSAVVPAVVMSLAVFMILNQLMIAREIVNILFTAIVGSLALGLALAFGLGGRDIARDLLSQAYEPSRRAAEQGKRDLEATTSRRNR